LKSKFYYPLLTFTTDLYYKNILAEAIHASEACTITVLLALALASDISYDCKWCSKLCHHLRS